MIDFISITPEERAPVEAILAKHPIRGIVALQDLSQALSVAYGAGSPSTVLIDRAGRVARVAMPDQISADVLEDLIADRPVQLPAFRPEVYPGAQKSFYGQPIENSNAIVKVVIGPGANCLSAADLC